MLEWPEGSGHKDDDEVDFESFQEMVIRGREQLQRACRDREREVQEKSGISDAEFMEFRDDLVGLWDLFVRFDMDGTLSLSMTELMFMLQESGLAPKCAAEKEDFKLIFQRMDKTADKEFVFVEFLSLVRVIRNYKQERRREELVERFLKYDRDKSGSLSASEISMLLLDLGFVPQNRKEQEELAYIISQVDEDGSGFIDFGEFQELSQRIDEKLKSFRYEREIEVAMCMGFTEKHMRDLRWVFDSLDGDGGGSLDASEVHHGLVMMRKDMKQKEFDQLFKSIDKDGTGHLCFLEFLEFMKTLRDSEAKEHAEDMQKLATKAKLLENRVLRRVLEYFRLSRQYTNSLSHDDLVDIFCGCFAITPVQNLHEALDVKCVSQLYEAAQRRDLAMQKC
jgi:Ca2+-binding EF-hand superfamily protein